METISIKALANKALQRNSRGNQTETQSFPDRKLEEVKLPCKETKNAPDCFSLDGTLEAAFEEAQAGRRTDDRLLALIGELVTFLKTPWGFKVKDSPLIGDYWIINGPEARERIPAASVSFTLDELKPIVEASRVFKGAKVVKVIRPKEKARW